MSRRSDAHEHVGTTDRTGRRGRAGNVELALDKVHPMAKRARPVVPGGAALGRQHDDGRSRADPAARLPQRRPAGAPAHVGYFSSPTAVYLHFLARGDTQTGSARGHPTTKLRQSSTACKHRSVYGQQAHTLSPHRAHQSCATRSACRSPSPRTSVSARANTQATLETQSMTSRPLISNPR